MPVRVPVKVPVELWSESILSVTSSVAAHGRFLYDPTNAANAWSASGKKSKAFPGESNDGSTTVNPDPIIGLLPAPVNQLRRIASSNTMICGHPLTALAFSDSIERLSVKI